MPPIRLATQIGTQAFTVWRLADGTTLRTPMTLLAYRMLALPDAGAPERPPQVPETAMWEHSYEKFLLDTPSGEQEDAVRFGQILFFEDDDAQGNPFIADIDLEDNAPGRPGEHTGEGATITLPRPIGRSGVRVVNGELSRPGRPETRR